MPAATVTDCCPVGPASRLLIHLRHPVSLPRLIPLALAVQAALSSQGAGAAGRDADQPVKIEARTINGTVNDEARAEGDAELRRGGL